MTKDEANAIIDDVEDTYGPRFVEALGDLYQAIRARLEDEGVYLGEKG